MSDEGEVPPVPDGPLPANPWWLRLLRWMAKL
jgi:hypothetical protein